MIIFKDSESLLSGSFFVMGFSLLNGMEFFAAPKNGIPFSIKPPAMRVRVGCYTKKLPFGLQ
jgi:hypothetical protein